MDYVGKRLKVIKEIQQEAAMKNKAEPLQYKYNEDLAFAKIMEYINGTYGQHYVGNGDIQTVDFWDSLGSLETTSRDTAIKYLARYGKKNGRNEKDLLKAIHYIILMMHAASKDQDDD